MLLGLDGLDPYEIRLITSTTSVQLNFSNPVHGPGSVVRPRLGVWLLSIWIDLKDLLWTFVLKTPMPPTVNTVKRTIHTTQRSSLSVLSDLCCSVQPAIGAVACCHVTLGSRLT